MTTLTWAFVATTFGWLYQGLGWFLFFGGGTPQGALACFLLSLTLIITGGYLRARD